MAKKLTPKKGKISRLKASDLKNARGGLLFMDDAKPDQDTDLKESLDKRDKWNEILGKKK